MSIVTRELARAERPALELHLLALDNDDRRPRFGVALPGQGIRNYVARIDFDRDAVFGVFDDELRLTGAGHLARSQQMRIATESGEADAYLDLAAADPASVAAELLAERVGLFDFALKSQYLAARRLASAFVLPAAGAESPSPDADG